MRSLVPVSMITLLWSLAQALNAQESSRPGWAADSLRQVAALRVEKAPPRIDGHLDDPAWASAPIATGFVQREPSPAAPAAEETEVRVVYDAEAIYVAMRLHDTRADSIARPLARRDASIEHSDWAYVMLDSRDDNRTAYVFAVNPREVRKDLFVYDDAREDPTWDAVWSVATRVDSAGWTAEFRIPLSQLRFSPGQTSWGVNFGRYLARRGERSFWSPWLPSSPGYVSSFGVLAGLGGVSAPRRLELLPYAVGRLTRAPGEDADPFHRPNEPGGSLGLDLSYGLSSDFSLTATLNPDFGQVEADPAEVNLTAFETRFEERRPFFLEGTDIFEFGLSGGEDLFYPRRIGRRPQGGVPGSARFREVPEASTILGAVKLSGKTSGGWSLGFLDALTAPVTGRYVASDRQVREAAVEPWTNYGVLRATRDFRGGGSSVGAIFTATHRSIEDDALAFLPDAAFVGGMDARHRFGGGDYEVRGYAAASQVRGGVPAIQRLQRNSARYLQRPDAWHLDYHPDATVLGGAAASLQVARIGGSWRWEAEGSLLSPGFEANDLGYQPVADRIFQRLAVEYRRHRPGPRFRRWDLRLSQGSDWTSGGERVGTVTTLFSNFELANRWSGFAQLMRRYPALSTSALRGGPALQIPGYWRPVVSLRTDRRKRVSGRLLVNAKLGDAEGDRFLDVSPSVELRTAALELSVGPSMEWNRDPWQYVGQREVDGERHYFFGRLRQAELSLKARLNYTFSPGLSFQLYAEPFLNAGTYDRFAEVTSPRAAETGDRFRRFEPGDLFRSEADRYRVDLDGDGRTDTEFRNPDFNVRQLRSNAVLRWEYGPGSTLFLVWSQGRRESLTDGTFDLREGAAGLWKAPSTNVLLLKVSRWVPF
ncbi:MAG TPA: DUF5916 domain-containing protein [Longimicrobiaceae bacterium]|nr:DUF5916 domain-containing protein [Longimicrobiaceae bacterium]